MELFQNIKKFYETKEETSFVEIAQAFYPLINSYAKKLYYLEYEDSVQELTIALYEALIKLKDTDNEYACISYIKKTVIHKFCKLYYDSVNEKTTIDNRIELDLAINQMHNNVSEADIAISKLDLEYIFSKSNSINRILLKMLLSGYSDKEIAEKLGFSRQYINRIKKKLGKILLNKQ